MHRQRMMKGGSYIALVLCLALLQPPPALDEGEMDLDFGDMDFDL